MNNEINHEEVTKAIGYIPTVCNVILEDVTMIISAGKILIRPKVNEDAIIQTGDNDVIVNGNIFLGGSESPLHSSSIPPDSY